MENDRERILRGAIEGVARYGMEGLNMKAVSRLSGCNSSTIYTIFNGKEELLRCCFEQIDRQMAGVFRGAGVDAQALAGDPEGAFRRLWTRYFQFLTDHPAETLFYARYRDAAAFAGGRGWERGHWGDFIRAVRDLDWGRSVSEDASARLLWFHLLTTTLLYGRYVAEGVLPGDGATRERVFQLVTNGLRGLAADAAPERTGPAGGTGRRAPA